MERLKATKTSLCRLVRDVMISGATTERGETPQPPPWGEKTHFEKLRGQRTYFLQWPGHSVYFSAGWGCGYLSIKAYGHETERHISKDELRRRGMIENVEEKEHGKSTV